MKRSVGAAARVLDQVAWSAGLFLFNAAALNSVDLSTYSAIAVATATAFIAVAVARSYSTSAGIVIATRSGIPSTMSVDRRRTALTSAVIGLAAALALLVWMIIEGVPQAAVLSLLVFSIVFADAPRQCLIVAGSYVAVSLSSALYALAGAAVLVSSFVGSPPVIGFWSSTLLLLCVGTWALVLGTVHRSWKYPRSRVATRTAFSLGLEAAYFGIAGQIGLIALFAIELTDDTAALRVAYALVFSPAFSLVQGLLPLITRELSAKSVSGQTDQARRLVFGWILFVLVAAIASALVARLWLPLISGSPPIEDLLPFLLPVGLSLVAGQTLEVAVLFLRLVSDGRGVHLQRTVVASLDIALQVLGVFLFGVPGLIGVITGMSVVRLAIAAVYLRRPRC